MNDIRVPALLPAVQATDKIGIGQRQESGSEDAIAKDVIAAAARQLGGADRIAAWVREDEKNEQTFWVNIYPKILALQSSADASATPSITRIEREIVRPED